MSLSPIEYVKHIKDEAVYLIKNSQGLKRDSFFQDETLKRAFVRSIEIIGEATKKVPDEIRQKYSHIQWRAMAGMRDKKLELMANALKELAKIDENVRDVLRKIDVKGTFLNPQPAYAA